MGAARGDEERGCPTVSVLAKAGPITPTPSRAKCVLSKEEGVRPHPVFPGYRPQFDIRTTDVTGDITLPRVSRSHAWRQHPHDVKLSRNPLWKRKCVSRSAKGRTSRRHGSRSSNSLPRETFTCRASFKAPPCCDCFVMCVEGVCFNSLRVSHSSGSGRKHSGKFFACMI